MLPYESKVPARPERRRQLGASLVMSGLACVVGLVLWWQTAPGLWTLATFTPTRPVRPMGFTLALLVCMLGGLAAGIPLSAAAGAASNRPAARRLAVLGMLFSMLPALNFLLFFVIVFAREIELGG
jgi:hypothetical protein